MQVTGKGVYVELFVTVMDLLHQCCALANYNTRLAELSWAFHRQQDADLVMYTKTLHGQVLCHQCAHK